MDFVEFSCIVGSGLFERFKKTLQIEGPAYIGRAIYCILLAPRTEKMAILIFWLSRYHNSNKQFVGYLTPLKAVKDIN